MTTKTRRSAAASNLTKIISYDLLRPQDFNDVFGGPPRTILSHQLSATGFYDDIFWQTEKVQPQQRSGRNLPLFKIPSAKQISSDRCSRQKSSFFSDIFGWDAEKLMSSRSRSRSKNNSSSVLTSEELSPLRPAISDDDVSIASKLKPINVKSRWSSARIGHEEEQKWPSFQDSISEFEFRDKLWSCTFRFSTRNATAENLKAEQTSFGVSENAAQFNSPSSNRNVGSCEVMDEVSRKDEMEVDDIDEDELMSSYVIELDSCNRETALESPNDVDEAIAWAKDKFQKYCSQTKSTQEVLNQHQLSSQGTSTDSSPLLIEDEMSILDEKIRWWLIGKEADIRLQLSSLHHILWANSGWMAISLAKLMERSQVKKAYQKAVLCLHPDKLQQRGATLPHKHTAEKLFAALQDAWTTFINLDISCR